jgi:hypothetical protein
MAGMRKSERKRASKAPGPRTRRAHKEARAGEAVASSFGVEVVPVASLRPHPRNYKSHPEKQLAHIRQSLKEHGFYKNVVVARDGTIHAGHGVVQAAIAEGIASIPVRRLDVAADHPGAIRIVVADNEIPKLGEEDESLLAELLRSISGGGESLLGTGLDDDALRTLVPPEPEPPSEFTEYNLDIKTEHTCPKCGYQWSSGASKSRTITSPG